MMPSNGILKEKSDWVREDYWPILQFAREYNHIQYAQFDACTVHKVNLFALRENFDFGAVEADLDMILQTLPAIKRIFAKPITRLTDSGEVLPVESVRVVNSKTVAHIAAHSELWDNISSDGLKPKKLLTLNYEDNYSIYENIAFARLIDLILLFTGRNIQLLKDMLYANRDMNFNLLERTDHSMYFLAIGKLHMGYVRDFDRYRASAERCLDKLMFIDRVLRARLGNPVYRRCRQRSGSFALKRTNIFRMHKDYHRIYLLLKRFSDAKPDDRDNETDTVSADERSDNGYGIYCSLLSLFAAGHFNFTFDMEQPIDFFQLSIDGAFEAWRLKLETVSYGPFKAIRFDFLKDTRYSILLIPAADAEKGKEALARFQEHCAAAEYLLAVPVEEGEGGKKRKEQICLSLFDIESFRRIQQILLRGMIYADQKRTVCPFCGQEMLRSEDMREGEAYECGACRTQILHLICPETKTPYFATRIKHFRPSPDAFDEAVKKDPLLYCKSLEAQMHFRNITEIGENAEIICPHCRRVHLESACGSL